MNNSDCWHTFQLLIMIESENWWWWGLWILGTWFLVAVFLTWKLTLFWEGCRNSTSSVFKEDITRNKWRIFFIVKKGWSDTWRSPIVSMCHASTDHTRPSYECKRKWLHSSMPTPFFAALQDPPQHCWADISTLFERPLPNNSGSYLSQKEQETKTECLIYLDTSVPL